MAGGQSQEAQSGWIERSNWETLPTASNHLGVIEKFRTNLVGGFNHIEKYESQWEG